MTFPKYGWATGWYGQNKCEKDLCDVDLLMSVYAAYEPYAFECISKNPRYCDSFRLGRNSHVRPLANCVDQ